MCLAIVHMACWVAIGGLKANRRVRHIQGSIVSWPFRTAGTSSRILRCGCIWGTLVSFLVLSRHFDRHRRCSELHLVTLTYLRWRRRHHLSTAHALWVAVDWSVRKIARFRLIVGPLSLSGRRRRIVDLMDCSELLSFCLQDEGESPVLMMLVSLTYLAHDHCSDGPEPQYHLRRWFEAHLRIHSVAPEHRIQALSASISSCAYPYKWLAASNRLCSINVLGHRLNCGH
jgi:hypothetical protein